MPDSNTVISGKKLSTDREQAVVRLINCVVVVIYTTIFYYYQQLSPIVPLIYIIATPFSLALFAWTIKTPEGNMPRRIIGMLADLGTTTVALSISGEAAAPLFLIYLWTTFGNGFRYGKDYLYLSMTISLIGFSMVLYFSPFWSQHLYLGGGLLFTLSVLPVYIAALLRRLQAATEKAEQANTAKSQFLASMSHEIRTPLNGVVGMTEMLGLTRMTSEQKEYADTITSSAKTLLALIENILDFSKIEAGKTDLEDIDFDLYELINAITTMLFPNAQNKGVACKLHIAADVPYQLKGDSIHLRQVLINLLGNATKFTEKGSIELNIYSISSNKNQVRLRFEVIDTGIGMTEEEQALIFEQFSQADQSINRRFGGTGLGTAISKKLVELMDGSIGVFSESGIGSKFWFELEYVCRSRIAESVDDVPIVSKSGSILIVGNADNHSTSLVEHLEDWGFEWDQAGNIVDAWILIQNAVDDGRPYDVALIDHRHLGKEDTKDAIALQIASDPLAKFTSLILICHNELSQDRQHSLLSSGYFCILKAPVEKRFLFNALHATSAAQQNDSNVTRLVNFKASTETAGKLNIVVGEDNATNQKVIRTILEYAGHNVDIYSSGNAILDAIEAKDYDLIILDMHMPEINGIETAKSLRFLQTGNDRRPIIMLTADATVDAVKACEEADIDMFLTKPIASEKLLSTIEKLTLPDEKKESITSSSQGILNLDSLDKLSSLSKKPDFMSDLITGFVSDSKQLISNMELAIDQSDFDAIRDHAHAIKGSAHNIGAISLGQCASRIANLSQGGLLLNFQEMCSELNLELERTAIELNKYLEKHNSSAH